MACRIEWGLFAPPLATADCDYDALSQVAAATRERRTYVYDPPRQHAHRRAARRTDLDPRSGGRSAAVAMPDAIRSIQLSARQIAYLATASYLPADLRETVVAAAKAIEPMAIDATTADTVQSALTVRLGQAGFDADYEVTAEGAMLEELIDAFADV